MTASDECPHCNNCGAPITSGLMAAMCPHCEKCEFWPDHEDGQEFMDELGMRQPAQSWWPLQPTGDAR